MKAVDTNVLIYAFDVHEGARHDQAAALLEMLSDPDVECVLLWQAACEYLAYLRRQQSAKKLTQSDVDGELAGLLLAYPLKLPTPEVLHVSCDLLTRYTLSHWDSLLLAACIVAGVDTLYSEDMSHNGTYDSVTVINPFRTS